jgi:hypothetical protein
MLRYSLDRPLAGALRCLDRNAPYSLGAYFLATPLVRFNELLLLAPISIEGGAETKLGAAAHHLDFRHY